jgi:hypothetical protein
MLHTLIEQLAHLQGQSCDADADASLPPFVCDLVSGTLSCYSFDDLALPALHVALGLKDDAHVGKVLQRLIPFLMREINRAVWTELLRAVGQKDCAAEAAPAVASAAVPPSVEAHSMWLLLSSVTAASPLAQLLSADSHAASDPAIFFKRFEPAAMESHSLHAPAPLVDLHKLALNDTTVDEVQETLLDALLKPRAALH